LKHENNDDARFAGCEWREPDDRFGSWLCENAKALNRDRRSYSSKTVLVAQQASGFNLEIELKNIILRRVSIFEFLHSQGQLRRFGSPSMASADTVADGRHVSKVPSTEIGACDIEVRFTLELGHRAMLSSQHLFGCTK